MSAVNTSNAGDASEPVYWALNGFGVTVPYLLMNAVIVLVGVAILWLNGLVLDTMIRLKVNKEPADVMMCSLAAADLLTGVLLFYITGYNMSNYQVYRECVMRFGLLVGLIVTSVLHLVVLSLDRYVKIMAPYRYNQWFTMRSMLIASGLLWFFAIIYALLPVMGWNTNPDDIPAHRRKVDEDEDEPPCSFFGVLHADYLICLVVIFWIPLLVMGFFYVHIFKVAHRHAQLIAAQEGGQGGHLAKDRHSWKYTKTVIIIMGLYFTCWIPSGMVIILSLLGQLKDLTTSEQGTILVYTSSFAYLNSLVNPIVYAVKISWVRRRYLQVFCCRRGQTVGVEPSFYTAVQAGKTKSQRPSSPVFRVSGGSVDGMPAVNVT